MNMIEKVARAILKARYYDCEPDMYDGLDDFYEVVIEDHYADALYEARAAIEAMREPSDHMVRSMDGYTDLVMYDHKHGDCSIEEDRHSEFKLAWTVGVDAALKEHSE